MDHEITGPPGLRVTSEADADVGRTTALVRLVPGQTLRLVKYVAYGWSSRRSQQALNDQVRAALATGSTTGWAGVVADQRAYLDDFWRAAGVELDGDSELQQAVRLALFHVLQAGARAERRAIGAKGLTGEGYDGHTFWDTETFSLPVLSYLLPHAAEDALRWRHSILPEAQERARQLGLAGAAFPWRTIRGAECSAYWPAGTGAFHINADIADAVLRHVAATSDTDFERTVGLELLVATARLWRSLGHHDDRGDFRIDGVTGPDEYTAVVDNNVYTNLMAQQNLHAAADTAARYPREAAALGVDAEEMASRRDAGKNMRIPYDDTLGVHPQSEGFTHHEPFDFAGTRPESYPLLMHVPYFDLYRKQVVKQADLVLAMQLRPDCFTPEQAARSFAYYEAITVRDSSLSACTQSVMAARTGHLDLAYDYLAESALVDLHDLAGNTTHGMHIASMAGTWTAIVAGFCGMQATEGGLGFALRLPAALTRVSFGLRWQGRLLRIEVRHDGTTALLVDGPDLTIRHHGEPVHLTTGRSVELPPWRPVPVPEQVEQPPGREPWPRHLAGAAHLRLVPPVPRQTPQPVLQPIAALGCTGGEELAAGS